MIGNRPSTILANWYRVRQGFSG